MREDRDRDGNDIRRMVRDGYGKIARTGGACCGTSSCCGRDDTAERLSGAVGYSPEEMAAVPDGADLGLGCGNPTALASLKAGETVLDLGSGAGVDCFLAARQVGPTGRVIGVDMTSAMLERARANGRKAGLETVEFRLGEIEHLPVADASIDVVISNCVVNLSPDKPQVFREVFRVLKAGGRLLVSDLVLTGDLPEDVRRSAAAYVGCIAGAVSREEYLGAVRATGFEEVSVVEESRFPVGNMIDGAAAATGAVTGVSVSAVKPRSSGLKGA